MYKRAFKLAVVSDIHLGNRRTASKFIIANLDKHITNDKFLSGVDILFLAGDVLDELLDMSCDEGHDIELWFARTLLLCKKHNVRLRVLEGTPSHDRMQSQRFVTLNEIHEKAGVGMTDLRYVTKLEIEHMPDYGINVLYVPDKWGTSAQDALDQVHSHLAQHGIEKVDFAIMHGAFEHQLPFHDAATHNAQAYLAVVEKLIFVGHIHINSVFERIFAQGSFDRISHGEEKPKGFYTATIEKDGAYDVRFVENTTAAIYKSIFVNEFEMVDALLFLEKELSTIPEGSAVRLQAKWDSPLFANQALIKDRWPDYVWTFQPKDKEKPAATMLIDHKQIYVPLQLNRQNLTQVMVERLGYLAYPSETIARCTKVLESVVSSA